MSRLFYHVMQDNVGNLLFGVSGTMRLAGSGTLATIYGDEALTIILPNPMTNHPSFGSFKCFLGAGDYDFYMAKSGYTFETITGVQGHGTMAQQDAHAVAILGGTATLNTANVATKLVIGSSGVAVACMQSLTFPVSTYGLVLRPTVAGTVYPLYFEQGGGVNVGSISTTDSATSFNTTSDARLKDAVQPLAGALDVMRALNPVSFLWKADGSPGHGFLAHEVQAVIPDGVITGEQDAVDEHGQMVPQMIDYSKLVPYLIGAVKELTQQVEMLTAKLAAASA